MEDVNFPLDQSQVTSALRGLREAGEESSRPRRLEDSEDEFRNPEARDDEEVEQTAQAERTVIGQDRVIDFYDVLEQDQQQEQIIADIAEEALEVVVRGFTGSLTIQIAAVASKLTTEQQSGGAEALRNPLRADREPGVDPRGGAPTAEGFSSEPPSATERAAADLDQTPPTDSQIQQRIQEERVAEEESRARNEPALETPAPEIEPVEPPEEPLQEAVDNNPLRGPRPSDLRDDDATAVETERGQNVSNLI